MEFLDPVYGQVDFASIYRSWPEDKLEQTGVLKGICAEAWHRSSGPGVKSYLARKAPRRIARITCETRFGQRWFDIWHGDIENQLVVVKEPAPDSPVVFCCDLTACFSSIRVTFRLLSGRAVGTVDFSTALAAEPLVVKDLRKAACEQALQHGLLETRRQFVSLALPGLQEDPSDCLMLWPNQAVTEEELQDWLKYLQSEEPSGFRCLPIEDMSDASATSSLEASESGGSEELGSTERL